MLMTGLTPSTVTTKDRGKPHSGTTATTELLLSRLNLSQLGGSWPEAVVTETVLFVARVPLAATAIAGLGAANEHAGDVSRKIVRATKSC